MSTIYFDSTKNDDERRRDLYDGQIFVYSPNESTMALVELARNLAESAFAPFDPREAQHAMPVEQYIAILAELKPNFIHHPDAKPLIKNILAEMACDLDRTYFDLPRLRTSTCGSYLSSGLAYAFKPHRDTWYSAPMCQINWWMPVYENESENTMAFHSAYWDRPIKNSSSEFNYQEWNRVGRAVAGEQGKSDTRKQSAALEELELDPQLRVVAKPGGMTVFSAAQLHSTVPNSSNSTRISIDFRTVHLDELDNNSGAKNIDSAATGTTIRDYVQATDFTEVPDNILSQYEETPPLEEELSPQHRKITRN